MEISVTPYHLDVERLRSVLEAMQLVADGADRAAGAATLVEFGLDGEEMGPFAAWSPSAALCYLWSDVLDNTDMEDGLLTIGYDYGAGFDLTCDGDGIVDGFVLFADLPCGLTLAKSFDAKDFPNQDGAGPSGSSFLDSLVDTSVKLVDVLNSMVHQFEATSIARFLTDNALGVSG